MDSHNEGGRSVRAKESMAHRLSQLDFPIDMVCSLTVKSIYKAVARGMQKCRIVCYNTIRAVKSSNMPPKKRKASSTPKDSAAKRTKVSNRNPQDLAKEISANYGGNRLKDLGIVTSNETLDDSSALFKLLVACSLFAARINHTIASKTCQVCRCFQNIDC